MSSPNPPDGHAGFTMIELLAAVAIIGLLSAIAVPIFLSQRESTEDAAVRANLTSTRIALIAIMNTGDENSEQTLSTFAQTVSRGTADVDLYVNAAQYTARGRDWWCLQQTSVTGATFHVRHEQGVTGGACDPGYYSWAYYVAGDNR